MMPARTSARFATLLALAALLTACGSAPATPASTPAPSDVRSAAAALEHDDADADTSFAQLRIIHHQGAIEMAELAVTSAEVRSSGERIAAAQGPEIEAMSRWLDAWDEDQPDGADMSTMAHAGMQMEGQDQGAVMAELTNLAGTAFDRRFLQHMMEHHRGAIDAQSAEITEMDNLLRSV